MGLYRQHVFPRLMNASCNTASTRRIRARVCAPLGGSVLEVGFGSGLNLPYLPSSVTRLLAVEPLAKARDLAAQRLAATAVEYDLVGLDGQTLALDDDSVDAALSTWTLCSIPDPVAALREIGRVMRPGASLHFVEHGRAPDARVRTWQRRLNGVQRRVASGCQLDRDIVAIIEDAGMTITGLDTYYTDDQPKVLGWTFEGTARSTATGP